MSTKPILHNQKPTQNSPKVLAIRNAGKRVMDRRFGPSAAHKNADETKAIRFGSIIAD